MKYKILRLPSVIDRTGLSRSAIYEKLSKREFPNPVKLGLRAVGWRESDIENWLESLPERETNLL